MQAISVHPASPESLPYSPSNPAPSTALQLDRDVPIPSPSQPGELLVRVKATTIVRDMLTWPETYAHEYAVLGNDLAGTVTEVFSPDSKFKRGDQVFGMAGVDRAATWAEYTVVKEDEVALKPTALTFAQAAALPLSAQTAYEALFNHARLPLPTVEEVKSRSVPRNNKRVLITGAAGAVGVYLVQLAVVAGTRVVAATSSNARNGEFLQRLGADEAVEYGMLGRYRGVFDIIIDVVGGEVLENCWEYITETGVLVSVDSASFNFVEEHKKRGLCKAGVHALFFVVKGSTEALHYLAKLVDVGALQSFVVDIYPISKAREAYDLANGRYFGHGKFILTV
ncbi:hypothetical protein EYZ11_010980 [Aspergillus tanneri]|uniref:Enoyl reductase (ER) domain-containing protein n=1 Tax=Aspergillus tanneri TaxID=1220188 RepID=A0A4S3J9E8_9EURO|nr:uncharacterized protein ATNIH1004_009348 [Aspergillus tanneri]KAA8645131.1 hypothetical protein ATNIH1004_009348 [Aspergillus tanneri]THC89571.1 hypothetical protein EYZ11_010980 [Aspergillus tanneri]